MAKLSFTYEEHLQKIIGLTLVEADRALRASIDLWLTVHDVLSESYLSEHVNKKDSKVQDGLVNIMFRIITGSDEDFDDFYSTFTAPAHADRDKKPVAWTNRFIPDLMMDAFTNRSMSLKNKKKIIYDNYMLCMRARLDFKKKKLAEISTEDLIKQIDEEAKA